MEPIQLGNFCRLRFGWYSHSNFEAYPGKWQCVKTDTTELLKKQKKKTDSTEFEWVPVNNKVCYCKSKL